jgi:hypothetical protein
MQDICTQQHDTQVHSNMAGTLDHVNDGDRGRNQGVLSSLVFLLPRITMRIRSMTQCRVPRYKEGFSTFVGSFWTRAWHYVCRLETGERQPISTYPEKQNKRAIQTFASAQLSSQRYHNGQEMIKTRLASVCKMSLGCSIGLGPAAGDCQQPGYRLDTITQSRYLSTRQTHEPFFSVGVPSSASFGELIGDG